jgi:hypothetical protein
MSSDHILAGVALLFSAVLWVAGYLMERRP